MSVPYPNNYYWHTAPAEDLSVDQQIRLEALTLAVRRKGAPGHSEPKDFVERAKVYEDYIRDGVDRKEVT